MKLQRLAGGKTFPWLDTLPGKSTERVKSIKLNAELFIRHSSGSRRCNLLCRITANITILDNNVKAFLSIFVAELFAADFYYYAEGEYFLFIMWQYFLHSRCMCSKTFSYAYFSLKTFYVHSWSSSCFYFVDRLLSWCNFNPLNVSTELISFRFINHDIMAFFPIQHFVSKIRKLL